MENFKDLNIEQVYSNLKENISFGFIATREELKFTNIEQEFTTINFDMYFELPLLNSLENLVDLLLRDSIGQIRIDNLEKIKILNVVFGGKMFYKKGDKKGDLWEVIIIFPAKK